HPSSVSAFLLNRSSDLNAIALIVLLGITLQTRMYLESALLIAVMGFVGTVAMAKYLKRGSVIE
ncbi:MAG TPA: K+/H+ antiporter subunit F, partial [Marinobacter adhaerens]|nr:K+/H+ antiporter subunit F [Marinobacter adhaerens]